MVTASDHPSELLGGGTREPRTAFLAQTQGLMVARAKAAAAARESGSAPYVPPPSVRATAAARLKPASQLCTEEPKRSETGGALETCAQGFDRGVPCKTLYLTHSCCTSCDPCGFDGLSCHSATATNPWLSPHCPCEQVVLSGGCSYKGCAKPDALGVFSRRANWRTADGRYVYARDVVRPPQRVRGGWVRGWSVRATRLPTTTTRGAARRRRPVRAARASGSSGGAVASARSASTRRATRRAGPPRHATRCRLLAGRRRRCLRRRRRVRRR